MVNLLPIDPPLWRRALTYVAVALMPLSFNVEHLLHSGVKTYFSPFDVLLPVLALILLAGLIAQKPWVSLKLPPLPGILWAGWALLACLWIVSGSKSDAIKEWAKGPLFFVVAAVWVFQNVAFNPAELRRLALILGGSFAVCLLLALKQYAGPVGLPYNPALPDQSLGGASNIRLAGWYDFRGIFGAQVALLVPAAVAFAVLDKSPAVRWSALVFALAALCVTLAAGGFIGACAGIIAVACACANRRAWRVAGIILAALLALVIIILPVLPRHNPAVLLCGLAYYTEDAGELKPTAQLRRAQASLDLLAAPSDPQNKNSLPFWVKGAGFGKYRQINSFYRGPYMKPGHTTDDEAAFGMEADEPFTWSLFETTAVELGVAGLLLLLFIFGHWILSAYGNFVRLAGSALECSPAAVMALAAFGAGCGAFASCFFGSPLIRGIGGCFAFFYAVAIMKKE